MIILLITFVITCSNGHALLQKPAPRNLLRRVSGEFYCPHCLSSGGPAVQKANLETLTGSSIWPAKETEESSVRYGLCGDPIGNDQPHLIKRPTTASWVAGQVIDLEIGVTAHHNGYVEFRLCDNADNLSQKCLNEHLLERVLRDDDITGIDANYPERYYLDPPCTERRPLDSNTYGYNYGNEFFPNEQAMRMSYRLPANLKCTNCVLQMHYMTANSCNPPGYRTFSFPASSCVGDGGATGYFNPQISDCGTAWGEEFWNCADVEIRDSSDPPSTSSSSSSSSSATSSSSSSTPSTSPPVGCTTPVEWEVLEEWDGKYLGRINLVNNGQWPLTEWELEWSASLTRVFEGQLVSSSPAMVKHPRCSSSVQVGESVSVAFVAEGQPSKPVFVVVKSGNSAAYTCPLASSSEAPSTSSSSSEAPSTSSSSSEAPSTSSSSSSSEAPSSTPSPSSLCDSASAQMSITQSWGSGFQAEVQLNAPSSAKGFKVWFELQGGATLSGDAWNVQTIESDANVVSVQNANWYSGGNTSFGFNGQGSGTVSHTFHIELLDDEGQWHQCGSKRRAILRRQQKKM